DRTKPGAQGPGPTAGLRRRQHQDPAQEPIAFLTDVAGPHPPGAGPDPRRQADIAGDVLGGGEALDVPELEDQDDGDEGTNAGDGPQALHAGIEPPARDEFGIEASDLGIEERQQRPAVFADAAGALRQWQLPQLALTSLGEPALARGWLQIAPGEHGL